MISLRKPSRETIRRFLDDQGKHGFTYQAVGATAGVTPVGYILDHARIKLGRGEAVYERAKAALQGWDQFRIGWVEIDPVDAQIQAGELVAVVARKLFLWWSNACRLIYVIDESDPVRRFGFGYGTLPDHAGSGEERFLIEWDRASDEVHYDILAFSKPHQFLTRLGYPYMRRSQKRFGRESTALMVKLVSEPGHQALVHETIRPSGQPATGL